MPKIPTWGWIAIIVGAILLLRPRVAVGQGQGPATPMGSLGQVDMGAHQVPKSPGGSAIGSVNFTGMTTNFLGAGIAWPYRIRLEMQSGAFIFQVLGARLSTPFNTPELRNIPFNIPTNAPLGLYAATAFLQADGSDAVGNPNGIPADIPGAIMTHFAAVIVVAASGAAIPAGSIGSVNVSQAMAKAAQRFLQ